jgi:hypothetical protein
MPGPNVVDYRTPNSFGRRGGRGIRPWFLLPKVIAVGCYVGGLAAMFVLWLTGDMRASSRAMVYLLWMTTYLRKYLIVPSLLVAIVCGVLLFLQHPRTFIKLRWLRVKLALIAVTVPAAHLFLWSHFRLIDASVGSARAQLDHAAVLQFKVGLGATLAMTICIVVLGRLKPRLGQNLARDLAPRT